MTAGKVRALVVADRAQWVRRMLASLRSLPLTDEAAFLAAPHAVAAAESYLRRALEALLDLGRHLLAKGFGVAAVEYKGVAAGLADASVLTPEQATVLRDMAGYRNRLVHFYDEVTPSELYVIVTKHLGDVEAVLDALLAWLRAHPDLLDG